MIDTKFRGGQTRTPAQERVERERYKKYMDILKSSFSIKDTLYDEKHYGFLNKDYQVIQPLLGIDTLRFGTYAPTVHGLNFVVDQFNEFRETFLGFSQETGQSPPALISDLVPGKSYSNFDTKYQEYLASLSLRYRDQILKLVRDRQNMASPFLDPIQFFNHLNENVIFTPDYEDYHISKSGYAISSNSSVYETGLYVDLSVETPTNLDAAKGQMLSDPGFLCYITYVTQHGFSVDFNAPWRLILDLKHEKTMKNILNGRKKEDYWNFYYDQYVENTGFSYDYNNIRDFYETLYKDYYRVYNGLTIAEANRMQWDSTYRDLFRQAYRNSILGPGQSWVEIFTLVRLKEVGLIDSYQQFDHHAKALEIRNSALRIYGEEETNSFGLKRENRVSTGRVGSPDTGVAAYIATVCGQILKEKITQVEQ